MYVCVCVWFVYCTHTQAAHRAQGGQNFLCLSMCRARFFFLYLEPFASVSNIHRHTECERHVSGKIDYEMIYWPQKMLQYWLKLLPFTAFPFYFLLFVRFAISCFCATRRMRSICSLLLPSFLHWPLLSLAEHLNAFLLVYQISVALFLTISPVIYWQLKAEKHLQTEKQNIVFAFRKIIKKIFANKCVKNNSPICIPLIWWPNWLTQYIYVDHNSKRLTLCNSMMIKVKDIQMERVRERVGERMKSH